MRSIVHQYLRCNKSSAAEERVENVHLGINSSKIIGGVDMYSSPVGFYGFDNQSLVYN